MEPFISFFLALFTTIILITLLLKVAKRYHLYDQPGGRKMHAKPVPCLGGVAMAAGATLPTFIWLDLDPRFKSLLLGIGALSFMGLVDDLVRVSWHKKLLVQAAAALLVVVYGQVQIKNLGYWGSQAIILPPYLSVPFSFLFILGITNAINLSDGLDGLAAGLCTFTFAFLSVLAYIVGLYNCLVPLAAILGSIWGFLRFNTHPAAIFMGDSGSYFLGFSAAVFGIICTQEYHSAISPAILLLILGVPIIDTLCVMTERLLSGVPVFMPDRRHIHFRLMQIGLSHREAVITIYAIQALLTLSAFKMLFFPASNITLLFVGVGLTITVGLKQAEKRGLNLHRSWSIEDYRLKRFFERFSDIFQVNLPIYTSMGIISAYLMITPMLIDYQFEMTDIITLCVPVIISVCFFIEGPWLNILGRLGIYYVIATVTIATLNSARGTHVYHGMPLWFVVMLAVLSGCTLLYIHFAKSDKVKLTPLDLLIFLVTLAFSVTPSYLLPDTAITYPAILGMLVLTYTTETTLDLKAIRKNMILPATIISALIIGVRSAMSLLNRT